MNVKIRNSYDRTFTMVAYLAAISLVIVLLVILGPMLVKGSTAVWFDGTVEFRKMQKQLPMFNRGDVDELKKEIAMTNEYREKLYAMIDGFEKKLEGADTETLIDRAKDAYRDYGDQLKAKRVMGEEFMQLRSQARDIRDMLESALESSRNSFANEKIDELLEYSDDPKFAGTALDEIFEIARNFQDSISTVDLSMKDEFSEQLNSVQAGLVQLLGPREDQVADVHLAENKFGATRMDMAQRALDKIFNHQVWQPVPGKKSRLVIVKRREIFAGTEMVEFFDYLSANYKNMLNPKNTFYWQYFIDDSTPGHYFGGVGPEILGTMAITVVSMLIAIPLGIISAAWLVECSSDNFIFRIIRMCINTLAGVPSIVFGLFGLAFFVLFLMPRLGHEKEPCILTAAMTLSILTLPVMIRASEEAIKAVPRTYKEASLGLGAGKFRTFVLVILPAALPGILTGTILSLSRVAGETAPILFTGAVAFGSVPDFVGENGIPTLDWLFQPTRTLSYGAYDMAVGDRIAMMVPHNQFGMVATLIILILFLNGVSIILRSKIAARLRAQ